MTLGISPSAILLDTCAAIWMANAEPLPVHVIESIRHAGQTGRVYVSTASAWEIGMLARPKSVRRSGPHFLPDPKSWFARLMGMPGMEEATITSAIAIDASYLPGDFHSDPMDRLIVATARHLGIPIVTGDRKILAYAEIGHVRAIAC